jgi:NADPH-dependent glutamate synthase beta subunit-like oxidoreductase
VLDFYHDLFKFEGVKFETGVLVGNDRSRYDVTWNQLGKENDAVFLALGAGTQHNHSATPGHDLKNVMYALEILEAKNRELLGLGASKAKALAEFVRGKTVLIIGAGYTADDVASTLGRMGVGKIIMIKRSESAPVNRDWGNNPWPQWPRTREMEIPYATEEFGKILDYKPQHKLNELLADDNGAVRGVKIEVVTVDEKTGRFSGTGSIEEIHCQLAVFATGF